MNDVDILQFGVQVKDDITPTLSKVTSLLTDRTVLNKYIAASSEELTRRHVRGNKQDHATAKRLGATPTYYFQKIAELITSESDKDGAYVIIPSGESAISNLSKSAGGEGVGMRGPFAVVDGPVHIVAINANHLTIPISKFSYGRRAREFSGTFVVKSKRGNKIIARKAGKGIEPLFLLKEEVNLKQDRSLVPSDEQYLLAAELGAQDFVKMELES